MSNLSLIVTIVNKGYSDNVMIAARAAGARGGTVINARGTGNFETSELLGGAIEPSKEIVLILAENSMRANIMTAIYNEAGLDTRGMGISMAVPVDGALGGSVSSFDKTETE